MKASAIRHWRNGHAMDVLLGGLWDSVLAEGIPSRFLAILSGLSDDEAGSGGRTSGRLTQPESDIRHSDRTSRKIHAVPHAQSHNLNAPLSTRTAPGGSDA